MISDVLGILCIIAMIAGAIGLGFLLARIIFGAS